MKKYFAWLASALLIAALLPGCSASPEEAAVSEPAETEGVISEEAGALKIPASVTFTDALNRVLTIEPPRRIAALMGSFADIWCLAGGADTLAAASDDAWDSFGLDLGENVTNLGSFNEVNLELLLAAEPDLVLASSSLQGHLELLDTFEQAGISIAYFDVQVLDDYLDMLDICTQLTGCVENYELYGIQVQEQSQAALARIVGSMPTVLCLRASGSYVRVKGSDGNVLGEMLAELGCVNVADGDGSSLLEDLSLEAIMAADPDYIFAVLLGGDQSKAQTNLEETLLVNPAWQSLRAVQEGHFFVLDHTLYNQKPNARWGEAYEGLVEILYSN